MRKQTICIYENKNSAQLRGNLEADQRLCFRYTDSTFLLLLKFKPASVTVQPDFFNSVLRPVQDYFSSYETGQSVGVA